MSQSSSIVDNSPKAKDLHVSPPISTASNLILIDNYDSFTWNVYQYLVLEGATVTVFRNDQITLQELIDKKPTQLVVSPGPGHPTTDAGISLDAIRHFAGKIPIFGVCMGQQCIIHVYGGDVSFAGEIMHGKTSPLRHDNKGINAGIPQDISITRYHSLAGTYKTLPDCLEVSSWVANEDGSKGVIQGVRHKELLLEGVQFHPESILSENGRTMIRNFLHMQGGTWAENALLQKLSSTNGVTSSASAPTKKNNILQEIYAHRKAAVAAQKEIPGQRMSDLLAAYALNAAPPALALGQRLRQTPFGVSLMAEIKRASPSKGIFALNINAAAQAREYALAGASVISVLTEPEWFMGSIEDLRLVRQVLSHMPHRPAILRKEFIFDEYQILEARLAGADTVLLIVKMLGTMLLERLYKYSQSLGMEPLVEVQNAEEMATAVELGAKVIGVNNRNLESFEVDLGTTGRLRAMVPSDVQLCALSGINTHDDVLACQRDGVNAILVGEAIMRAPNAAAFIQQLCSGSTAPRKEIRPESLLVKICGTRTREAASEAMKAGADIIGMILVPGSKRCVTEEVGLAISKAVREFVPATTATTTTDALSASKAADYYADARARISGPRPKLIGVFADQSLYEVLRLQKLYDLDMVQLHGSEPVEWATHIPVPVIRCVKPSSAADVVDVIGQRGYHAAVLLDSGAGSGKTLDVDFIVDSLKRDPSLQVLLAGGLSAENVADVLKAVRPDCRDRIMGVDVSSGVEVDGKQSLERIREFVRAAKDFR